MAVTINGCRFAESDSEYEKSPRTYRGFVKRYVDHLEFYDKTKAPVAAINKHGVILKFNIRGGKKTYGFAWKEDAAVALFKNPNPLAILKDIKKAAVMTSENYVNTRKDGGMFESFPDHTYRFK